MITEKKINGLLAKAFEGTDRYLVELKIGVGNIINIFVDSDSSITIDDCVEISRFVESGLDRDKEDFELRVSSPGLDQPFKLLRQYKKYLGKEIEITDDEAKKHSGVLLSVNEKELELEEKVGNKGAKKTEIRKYSFDHINKGKPVISFNRK